METSKSSMRWWAPSSFTRFYIISSKSSMRWWAHIFISVTPSLLNHLCNIKFYPKICLTKLILLNYLYGKVQSKIGTHSGYYLLNHLYGSTLHGIKYTTADSLLNHLYGSTRSEYMGQISALLLSYLYSTTLLYIVHNMLLSSKSPIRQDTKVGRNK